MCGGSSPPEPQAPPAPAPAQPSQDVAQTRQRMAGRRIAGTGSDQGTMLTGPGGLTETGPLTSPTLGG